MDKIIIDIILVKGLKIEQFKAQVNSSKHAKLIKANQRLQFRKILDIMENFKKSGFIKSTKRPKNKIMQDQLDKLSSANRTIKKTIKQLNQIFQ